MPDLATDLLLIARNPLSGRLRHRGAVEKGLRAALFTELITTGLLLVSAALSWVALVDVGFMHHDARITLFPWITSGDLQVTWALRIDTLTAVMLVVVNTV